MIDKSFSYGVLLDVCIILVVFAVIIPFILFTSIIERKITEDKVHRFIVENKDKTYDYLEVDIEKLKQFSEGHTYKAIVVDGVTLGYIRDDIDLEYPAFDVPYNKFIGLIRNYNTNPSDIKTLEERLSLGYISISVINLEKEPESGIFTSLELMGTPLKDLTQDVTIDDFIKDTPIILNQSEVIEEAEKLYG